MTNGSLMKVESIAECSPWSILQYFSPALNNNQSEKTTTVFCLFGGRLRQVLLHRPTHGTTRKRHRTHIATGQQEDKVKQQGLEVINFFPCSTQLSRKFILLINVEMPTNVDILTFISMNYTTSERLKARKFFICWYFCFYEQLKFHAQLSWNRKKFYNLRACSLFLSKMIVELERALRTISQSKDSSCEIGVTMNTGLDKQNFWA